MWRWAYKTIAAILILSPSLLWAHQRSVVPRQAALYRATVIREVRFYWGMAESPATFLGQIHQESGFREDAKSAFASGLTQFTKPTAEWIQGLYARDLRELCAVKTGCPLEPKWAIRAMVLYDKRLWNGYPTAMGDERKAFMLSGYNGGKSNLDREIAKCRMINAITSKRTETSLFHSIDGTRKQMPAYFTLFSYLWPPKCSTDSCTDDSSFFQRHNRPAPFSNSAKFPSDSWQQSWVFQPALRISQPNSSAHFSSRLWRMVFAEKVIARTNPHMNPIVLSNSNDFQIIKGKVISMPIFVVNERLRRQSMPKHNSSDQPMNIRWNAIHAYRWIAIKQENALELVQPDMIKNSTEIARFIQADGRPTFHIQTITESGIDCNRWFNGVENVCLRAAWACKENRGYPRRILLELRHHYE